MPLNSAAARVEPAGASLEPAPAAWEAAPAHLHAPRAGATASLLVDYRELFKLRVTGMVTLTGWAGFYLGSMRSGISSLQPGLVETLAGITAVSAGAAALNQAIERKLDAKMNRTADRPMATGRISLAHGITVGLLAIVLGSLWLTRETNLVTGGLALLTAFLYVAVYTPLKRVHHPRDLHWSLPRRHAAAARLDRRPRPHRVAGRGPLRHPLRLAVPPLHVHRLALSRRLRPRRHSHAARRAARRMVHRHRSARLCRPHDSCQPPAVLAAHGRPDLCRQSQSCWACFISAYTIRFSRIVRARNAAESRMYARDLLKVSVVYLPLLLAALMLNATGK